MKIFSAQLKGTTIVVSGSSASITGSFTGSIAGIDINATNTFTASTIARLNSIETISSSNDGRVNSLESFTSSTSARLNSIETISASNLSRLGSLEAKTGSLASTGSNTFIGTQTITGSLYISSDLIVQGSSSLQNITASAVSIGTNIINLNTANPAIRYAGLSIGDSGSIGSSGSFLYDSVQDEMIFIHRGANSTVTSSVVLMGPQTYDNIGSETYPTSNRIQKGTGNEHLVDSNIIDNGTTIVLNSNTEVTGSVSVLGDGVFINRVTSGEPYMFFRKNGVNRGSIYGVDGGGLRIFDNNDAQILTITSSFVGINTSVPGQQLEVRSADGQGIRFKNAGSSDKRWDLVGSGNDFRINEAGVGAVTTFKAGGNVGIGLTNPTTSKFEVNGTETIYGRSTLNATGNYSNGAAGLTVESNSWAIVDANIKRQVQRSIGYVGDYEQHVILLHPIYNSSLIEFSKCTGTIHSTRGWTYAGLISDTYHVDTATGYASIIGTLTSNYAQGRLYTCTYNGVKYMALLPQYRTSATSYMFDGYIGNNTGGETLKLISYRNSSTGTILNSEINNSLTPYTENDNFINGLLYPRQGIRFNSGATTLNYYEEGSFTPTNVGSNMAAVTVGFGKYVRIGNQVTVNARWTVSPGGTGQKYFVFHLPFGFAISSSIGYTGAVSNYNNGLSAYSSNVGTTVRNSSGSDTQQYVEAVFTTNAETTMHLSMTYFTF